MNAELAPNRGWLVGPPTLALRLLRQVGPASSSVTVRALLASRVVVFLAGAGGVLAVSKQPGWRINDIGVTAHLGGAAQLLAGSTARFDSIVYLSIAHHGYAATGPDSFAFYPLYPMMVRALGFVTGSQLLAGVLISVVSFGAALVLLHRLTEHELGRRAADTTVLLLAFAPLSFYFSAVYTESLFLLLSLACVSAARHDRWGVASVLGAMATLTRPTGIILLVPLVILLVRSRPRLRTFGWTLLLPATLAAYLASLVAQGHSWAAPFQAESAWGRLSVGPFAGFAMGVRAATSSLGRIVSGSAAMVQPTRLGPLTPEAESILLLLLVLATGVVLVRCFRQLPLYCSAYAATALLASISSPQRGQPLVSFDRYLLVIFPLWMVAGAWLAERRHARFVIGLCSLALVAYTVLFSSYAFIA